MKKIIFGLFIILFTLVFSLPVNADGNRNRNSRDYRDHHGYRYKYHGQRHMMNRYRGHWRSWDSWHDHYEHYRHLYKHHRYYEQNGHLYVEIETEDGTFIFSIGR